MSNPDDVTRRKFLTRMASFAAAALTAKLAANQVAPVAPSPSSPLPDPQPGSNPLPPAEGHCWTYAYDSYESTRPVQVLRSERVTFTYDSAGLVTSIRRPSDA